MARRVYLYTAIRNLKSTIRNRNDRLISLTCHPDIPSTERARNKNRGFAVNLMITQFRHFATALNACGTPLVK
jgi:hypothetical protein